ncbi:MAG: 4Fe-4S binding protein [Lachnospiraceae bacterium]
MKTRTKIMLGIVCAAMIAIAYIAPKLSFFEFAEEVFETNKEQLFTKEHAQAMLPFFIILLLAAVGIGLCIWVRKKILEQDASSKKIAQMRSAQAAGRVKGQKKFGFMTIRWGVMIVSFFLIIYGGILFGVHLSGISVPAFFCPANGQQLTGASCYTLSHIKTLLGMPIKDIVLFVLSTVGFTLLFGRMICGFFCPMGLVQDIMHAIRQKTKVEGISLTEKMYKGLTPVKWTMVFLMLGLTFIGGNFCDICPALALSPAFAGMKVSLCVSGFMMVLILIGSFFKRRIWCNICPLGFLLGLAHKISPFRIEKNCQSCTECGACYEACPMGIKTIYTEREKADVTDMNCIMCGECVKKCPENDALSMTFAGKKFYTASRKQAISGYEQTEKELKRKIQNQKTDRREKE